MSSVNEPCLDCAGYDFDLRRRRISGGAVQYCYQCLTCGRAQPNPVRKATIRKPDELPLFDEDLKQRGYAAHLEKRATERATEREAWFREHSVYLRSPVWKKRRDAVLDRAKGLCEGCRDARAVHVHHLTYDHWQDELLWELVAVCEPCHEKCHKHMQEKGQG